MLKSVHNKLLALFLLIAFSFLASQLLELNLSDKRTYPKRLSPTICKPTFPDGDGPYYQTNAPFREKLSPDEALGEQLIVHGKLLKSDCKTVVPNAVLDIWQADPNGKYQADSFRGRVKTDNEGNYEFETLMPKGYGEGTGYRPPHIHFKVWVDDKLIITSEMFFPEVKGTPGFDEAYIMDLQPPYGYHDIILP